MATISHKRSLTLLCNEYQAKSGKSRSSFSKILEPEKMESVLIDRVSEIEVKTKKAYDDVKKILDERYISNLTTEDITQIMDAVNIILEGIRELRDISNGKLRKGSDQEEKHVIMLREMSLENIRELLMLHRHDTKTKIGAWAFSQTQTTDDVSHISMAIDSITKSLNTLFYEQHRTRVNSTQ